MEDDKEDEDDDEDEEEDDKDEEEYAELAGGVDDDIGENGAKPQLHACVGKCVCTTSVNTCMERCVEEVDEGPAVTGNARNEQEDNGVVEQAAVAKNSRLVTGTTVTSCGMRMAIM